MGQSEQRRELIDAVAPTYGVREIVLTLAGCLRSPADAKRFMRVAYAHARGWIAFLSVPSGEWELIYSGLDCWDDPVVLEDVCVRLEGIRDQIIAFHRVKGMRDAGGFSAALGIIEKQVVITYLTAAVYAAVRRRVRELRQAAAA
jgi:hypothetical protein